MAKLDLSGISKLGGYLLSNEGPLDVRTVVTEISHLTELVTGRIAYPGMIVYVNSTTASDKGLYVCESNTGNGTWTPLPIGTVQISIDSQLDANSRNPVQNSTITSALNSRVPEIPLSNNTNKILMTDSSGNPVWGAITDIIEDGDEEEYPL